MACSPPPLSEVRNSFSVNRTSEYNVHFEGLSKTRAAVETLVQVLGHHQHS